MPASKIPDELWLEIFSFLEAEPECQDVIHRAALYSACLSSKVLNRSSTKALYNTIHFDSIEFRFRLPLLMRTLLEHQDLADMVERLHIARWDDARLCPTVMARFPMMMMKQAITNLVGIDQALRNDFTRSIATPDCFVVMLLMHCGNLKVWHVAPEMLDASLAYQAITQIYANPADTLTASPFLCRLQTLSLKSPDGMMGDVDVLWMPHIVCIPSLRKLVNRGRIMGDAGPAVADEWKQILQSPCALPLHTISVTDSVSRNSLFVKLVDHCPQLQVLEIKQLGHWLRLPTSLSIKDWLHRLPITLRILHLGIITGIPIPSRDWSGLATLNALESIAIPFSEDENPLSIDKLTLRNMLPPSNLRKLRLLTKGSQGRAYIDLETTSLINDARFARLTWIYFPYYPGLSPQSSLSPWEAKIVNGETLLTRPTLA